jgi:hypothetical protein
LGENLIFQRKVNSGQIYAFYDTNCELIVQSVNREICPVKLFMEISYRQSIGQIRVSRGPFWGLELLLDLHSSWHLLPCSLSCTGSSSTDICCAAVFTFLSFGILKANTPPAIKRSPAMTQKYIQCLAFSLIQSLHIEKLKLNFLEPL